MTMIIMVIKVRISSISQRRYLQGEQAPLVPNWRMLRPLVSLLFLLVLCPWSMLPRTRPPTLPMGKNLSVPLRLGKADKDSLPLRSPAGGADNASTYTPSG